MIHLDVATRTSVIGILYTATDVDGGHSMEQRELLEALARHVMRVSPSAVTVIEPDEAAAVISKPRLRKAIGEILVMLELVRHPPSAALTSRVAEYLAALDIEDGFQSVAKDYLENAREQVGKDWERVREPDLVEHFLDDLSDSELNEKMIALSRLPPLIKPRSRSVFTSLKKVQVRAGANSVTNSFSNENSTVYWLPSVGCL